jgi:hypothetical protein
MLDGHVAEGEAADAHFVWQYFRGKANDFRVRTIVL